MHTTIKKKVRKKEYEVTFSPEDFQYDAGSIKLVGSFNGWDTQADDKAYALTRGRNKKFKSIKLTLPAGEYEYKYYNPESGCFIEPGEAPGLYGDEQVGNAFGTANARLVLPEL